MSKREADKTRTSSRPLGYTDWPSRGREVDLLILTRQKALLNGKSSRIHQRVGYNGGGQPPGVCG